MSDGSIHKTMNRDDLLDARGRRFTQAFYGLAAELEAQRLPVTSWYGGLPRYGFPRSVADAKAALKRILAGGREVGAEAAVNRGGAEYAPLPGVGNDDRHPWFLCWEAYWVTSRGPCLDPSLRVLDAGGTASLFSSYLASLGAEVHSIDLNERLVAAGRQTAERTGWRLEPACMDMTALEFPDASFDHAYSICVFEHLDHAQRARALGEIARVLKPGGVLSVTFDYGAPGVHLAGRGPCYDEADLIRTPEDVARHFFSCPELQPVGDARFEGGGERYLAWPSDPDQRYTFGAVFLRRR